MCVHLSGTLEQLAHTLRKFLFWFSIFLINNTEQNSIDLLKEIYLKHLQLLICTNCTDFHMCIIVMDRHMSF
jgi:hypothetical protein